MISSSPCESSNTNSTLEGGMNSDNSKQQEIKESIPEVAKKIPAIKQTDTDLKNLSNTISNNNNRTSSNSISEIYHEKFQGKIQKKSPEESKKTEGELSGITELSKEFYDQFIEFQRKSEKPENLIKADKFCQANEKLFYTSLYGLNKHFLKKFAVLISQLPDKITKNVIDKLFENIEKNIQKQNPQCAYKFGNALAGTLMNIFSTSISTDWVRFGSNDSVQIGFKGLLVNTILADSATGVIFELMLTPKFMDSLVVLLHDHIQQAYLENKYQINKLSSEKSLEIKKEASEKLIEIAMEYHEGIGIRDPEIYKRIWPQGLKTSFTRHYETLEKAGRPNTADVGPINEEEKTITLTNGRSIAIPYWKIGNLALFGSICLFRVVFNNWLNDLKKNLNKFDENYIFPDSELLRNNLKELLFDPNFYSSLLQAQLKSNNCLSDNQLKALSGYWETNLVNKLTEIESTKLKNDEQELFQNIRNVVVSYQGKLPSLKFKKELSNHINDFKNKRIAGGIRSLLNDPSFMELIQALPNFKLTEKKKEQHQDIKILFQAIMDNNVKSLSSLSDKQFAGKLERFLNNWGEQLQNILCKKPITHIIGSILNLGLFKGTISNMLQKEFKLPISVEELPSILGGLQKLPETGLVDLFRGFAQDPNLKEIFKEKAIHRILHEVDCSSLDEFETYIFGETFLNGSFDALVNQSQILGPTKISLDKFIHNTIDLIKKENFNEVFKRHWKEDGEGGFRKLLVAIASNFDICKQYNRFIAYVLFKNYQPQLNDKDSELIYVRALSFLGLTFDVPSLTAAKKIRGGKNFTLTDTNVTSDIAELKRRLEEFAMEGKILGPHGEEIFYWEALALADLSFINFDEIENRKDEQERLLTPDENALKMIQGVLDSEIESLVNFSETFLINKTEAEQKEFWHFVLRLAIECGKTEHLKLCLMKMEKLQCLTTMDIGKHLKFIATNITNKACYNSCQSMINYFVMKSPNNECAMLLKTTLSNPNLFMTGLNKGHNKENQVLDVTSTASALQSCPDLSNPTELNQNDKESQILNVILEPTVSALKSCINTLPNGNVKNFLQWALNDKNSCFKDYLQLTSLTETANLELRLFNKILDLSTLAKVLPKLGYLNTYFFTEVFSDSVALQLANLMQQDHKKYQSRKMILKSFNEIMIDMLNNKSTQELQPEDFKYLSIYEQSLSSEEMQRIVTVYQDESKVKGIAKEIEYSFFPMLNLNITSCSNLLQTVKESKLYPIIQSGLIERYKAGNELLDNDDKVLPLAELIDLGRQTILVAPTIAYCIAVLDQVKPNPKLVNAISDNSLKHVLDTAALLVRLLNDIGTVPLSKPEFMLQSLKNSINLNSKEGDFLIQLKDTTECIAWSRVIKDINYGEYNVALDNLRKISDCHEAWEKFQGNISELSRIYQKQKGDLIALIQKLDEAIGDKIPGQLILNFVGFHEKLYSRNAMEKGGEYNIGEGTKK